MATEYVRLCGYEHGEIGNAREKNCQVGKPKYTLDEIAEQLGTSQRSLSRALSIERNLTEPMKELLDTGVISKTLAADVIAGLTPEEQEELIAVLPVTERITRREMEKYIEEIKELKNRPPQVIDNTDYSKIDELQEKIKELEIQKRQLETKVRMIEEDASFEFNRGKILFQNLLQRDCKLGQFCGRLNLAIQIGLLLAEKFNL